MPPVLFPGSTTYEMDRFGRNIVISWPHQQIRGIPMVQRVFVPDSPEYGPVIVALPDKNGWIRSNQGAQKQIPVRDHKFRFWPPVAPNQTMPEEAWRNYGPRSEHTDTAMPETQMLRRKIGGYRFDDPDLMWKERRAKGEEATKSRISSSWNKVPISKVVLPPVIPEEDSELSPAKLGKHTHLKVHQSSTGNPEKADTFRPRMVSIVKEAKKKITQRLATMGVGLLDAPRPSAQRQHFLDIIKEHGEEREYGVVRDGTASSTGGQPQEQPATTEKGKKDDKKDDKKATTPSSANNDDESGCC